MVQNIIDFSIYEQLLFLLTSKNRSMKNLYGDFLFYKSIKIITKVKVWLETPLMGD